MSEHDRASMNWQRKVLALFGFLLPILGPLFGFLAYSKNGPHFWWSISATFYATSNILMIGVLAVVAFFLWTYKGYDIGDSFTCKFSAGAAIGVLVFPCECDAADITTGILNLSTNISNVFHCISAALLFASFAYMIGFRFTKTAGDVKSMTIYKQIRNFIYKICAGIIVFFMIVQVVTSLLNIGWMTIVNEAIMLWAFSFAWAVKADVFIKFKDKIPNKINKNKENNKEESTQ